MAHLSDSGPDTNLYNAQRSCEELALLSNVYSVTLGPFGDLKEPIIYMGTLSNLSTVRLFAHTDLGNYDHTPSLPKWNLDHVRNFEITLGGRNHPEYADSELASRITVLRFELTVCNTLIGDIQRLTSSQIGPIPWRRQSKEIYFTSLKICRVAGVETWLLPSLRFHLALWSAEECALPLHLKAHY